jgi:hypothetical protein
MKKDHVLICLLTYSDSVNVSFLWWLDTIRGFNLDEEHPRTYEVMYLPGLRPVSFARNVAVTNFLKHPTANKLWFIDDDLIPTDKSLNVFNSNADIISGLYYLLLMEDNKPTLTPAVYTKTKGGFEKINTKNILIGQNIISIDAAGTGSLIIDKKVLLDEKMMNSKEYNSAEGEMVTLLDNEPLPYFRTLYKPNGSEERSEDLDFVWRAKQLGYSCECVLDARFLHKKEMLVDWFTN